MADSPTPSPEAATPETAPAEGEGTAESGGEAKEQGAPSFTHVDPNTLSPELRGTYDNMLRDYKSKTGELAEQRKGLTDSQEKARLYDEISKDEAFVSYWNKPGKQDTPEPNVSQETPKEISEDDWIATI